MTKEQWLENMRSTKPDYKGLIRLKNQALLSYLTESLLLTASSTKDSMKVLQKFLRNVVASSGTDFVLTKEDKKLLKNTKTKQS
jgi:hypothetical protein